MDSTYKINVEKEGKENKMNDCISRQAAIDALYHVDECNERSVEAIRNLPSAQPEIIRCKDCKHYLSPHGNVTRRWLLQLCREVRRMTLFEALQQDSPYVFYSDDHGFCINTADVMDILTMDKESVIYRQAAIDVADAVCTVTGDKNVAKVWDQLRNLPSAGPERKMGKWIYDGDCYICNKCKSAFDWWADSQCSNFCPNCGADMRGGQE